MRRHRGVSAVLVVAAALVATVAGVARDAQARRAAGRVAITLWHGYTGAQETSLEGLVADFNRTHPSIRVTARYAGNPDYALQKVLTAIAGGRYPDISYLYGSWAANIAKSPKTVVLDDLIKANRSFGWSDFYPSEREAATVDGKIVGVPALVDNLALVYNKKLFRQAGVPLPTASWTWKDFRAAARKLTVPAKKQFGWAYVADGGEDTVWRYEALLWQSGGALLTRDLKRSAFSSPGGEQALSLLQGMARQDRSVYLDSGNQAYSGLFGTNHIAMLFTGPWDLATFRAAGVDYGVQPLPANRDHQTISGPDNWVVFDNGAERKQAAFTFLSWLTAPQQVLRHSLQSGELPIKQSVTRLPGYAEYTRKFPGTATFVKNLANVRRVRPTLTTYPKISEALGQAVVSVLLGKATPKQVLDQAAATVDSVLARPS